MKDGACEGLDGDHGDKASDHVYLFEPAVGGNDQVWGIEEVVVWLDAGEDAFIVMDGYGSFFDESGPYTLSVEQP